MRWLGAFGLRLGLLSLTIRTPLEVSGTMKTSPSKPSLLAWNVPMCAMCRLLLFSSPRPSRPRWRSVDADGRRRTHWAAATRKTPAAHFLDLREEPRHAAG